MEDERLPPAGVKVKICGITNREDAQGACGAGADALGFVFFPKSPRCVAPETAREIVAALPPFVAAVGLFVNEAQERVREIASFCGLDVLQLHGDEPPGACRISPWRTVKAVRVQGEESLSHLEAWPVSALLFDAYVPGTYGGTGHRFDWRLAARAAQKHRIILAGGLTEENVTEAVRIVRPYAVDVSSGVEAAPGKKDQRKMSDFIRAAKTAAFS